MTAEWFYYERFLIFGYYISVAGICAFLAALLVGNILSSLIQGKHMRRLLRRLHVDKHFAELGTTAAGLAVVIASFVIGLELAGMPINWRVPLPVIGLSLTMLIKLVVMLVAVFWLASLAKRVLFNRFLSKSGMDRSLQYSLAQVTGYGVLAVGCVVVLQNAGLDLSALAVFAGAVGVGVGLGLQNIASNFISGLVILGERPIKIGDRIEVGGTFGIVRHIHPRSTVVVTNDNIAVIVPNSKLVEDRVINWSHGDSSVRFRIPIGVAYGSDVEKVRETLLACAREHPDALTTPPATVFFDSFGESSLNFLLVVWTADLSWKPSRFQSDLNFIIERKLREAGIQIPFPQRDLYLKSVPEEFGRQG